jgi:hypothetical protein
MNRKNKGIRSELMAAQDARFPARNRSVVNVALGSGYALGGMHASLQATVGREHRAGALLIYRLFFQGLRQSLLHFSSSLK